MSKILDIFPPKKFLRSVRWMVPVTALIAYLWGLGAAKDTSGHYVHRYVGGSYLTAWAMWFGLFALSWFAVRLQMKSNQQDLERRTTCPTCGQPMEHSREGELPSGQVDRT
jgi:hypothetical protein